MNQVKQIPLDGTPFEANGKTYQANPELSIDRWIKMQEFQIQLGFGIEYDEMQKNWLKVNEYANKQKFTDIAVLAYNTVKGISSVYTREPLILKFCALFLNTKDEDPKEISDSLISEKIEDWKKEGLGIDGFFAFSLAQVRGLKEDFLNAIQNGLETSE